MSNHTAHNRDRNTTLDEITPNARILVVDDDDILRGLHEAVLSLAGYGTQSAADGEEALLLLATGEFDLVLTDCNMPRLDGIGLIRALRAAGSRIPVMMVSGSPAAGSELPDDVRNEIAVKLPKPAKTCDILAGIGHALRWLPAAPGLTRIGDVFPATAAAPRTVRTAGRFAAAA